MTTKGAAKSKMPTAAPAMESAREDTREASANAVQAEQSGKPTSIP